MFDSVNIYKINARKTTLENELSSHTSTVAFVWNPLVDYLATQAMNLEGYDMSFGGIACRLL